MLLPKSLMMLLLLLMLFADDVVAATRVGGVMIGMADASAACC